MPEAVIALLADLTRRDRAALDWRESTTFRAPHGNDKVDKSPQNLRRVKAWGPLEPWENSEIFLRRLKSIPLPKTPNDSAES